MTVTILKHNYNINRKRIDLPCRKINDIPLEICNLINLRCLKLDNNQLSSIPKELLKIKNALVIDKSGYKINNLDMDCEIIIFYKIWEKISNLPISIKEICLKDTIDESKIKIPFECVIKRY